MRLAWLSLGLAGCLCHLDSEQVVKLHFEVADAEALRDASAQVCFTSAIDRERECTTILLGVGRLGGGGRILIDTPDPDVHGSLVARWTWGEDDELSDGDLYEVSVQNASGDTLYRGQREVRYGKPKRDTCGGEALLVDEALP